jgi:hypothetical protein
MSPVIFPILDSTAPTNPPNKPITITAGFHKIHLSFILVYQRTSAFKKNYPKKTSKAFLVFQSELFKNDW